MGTVRHNCIMIIQITISLSLLTAAAVLADDLIRVGVRTDVRRAAGCCRGINWFIPRAYHQEN